MHFWLFFLPLFFLPFSITKDRLSRHIPKCILHLLKYSITSNGMSSTRVVQLRKALLQLCTLPSNINASFDCFDFLEICLLHMCFVPLLSLRSIQSSQLCVEKRRYWYLFANLCTLNRRTYLNPSTSCSGQQRTHLSHPLLFLCLHRYEMRVSHPPQGSLEKRL